MFIGFHLPVATRGSKAFHLWTFYRQIAKLAPADLALICNIDYLATDTKGWEHQEQVQAYHDYVVPSPARVREYEIHLIPSEIFREIDTDNGGITAWQHLLAERYEPLEFQLSAIISQIMQRRKVEAIFAWCNTPSLKYVAGRYGIPVIHTEMGALRHPHYIPTAYFDFSGVNADTECERRYTAFRNESIHREFPYLSREALLEVVRSTPRLPQENASPTFAAGVAKQVNLDSNIIAFSDGWDARKLVAYAVDHFGRENILVRKHPYEPEDDCNDAILAQDASETAIEFSAKCHHIVTINSSVGFEALLYGKKATMLGQNPFRFITCIPPEEELELRKALNFATFGYLVPFKLIYNADYLRWRLSSPSEIDIMQYHLGYWLTEKSRKLVESLGESSHLRVEQLQWQEKQQQWEAKQSQLESHRAELELQNTQLESRISQFELQNSQLESHRAELELQNTQLDSRNSQLESRSAELELQNTQLDSRNSQLESRSAELELQNTQLESRNSQLELQNSQLESRSAELDLQNTQLDSRNSQLELQNSQLESRSAELELQNTQLESRNSRLELQNSQLESRSAELELQNTQLESRNSRLELQNSQLESRSAELELQNTQFESRNSQLELQSSQLESRCAGLELQNTQFESRNSQLELQNSQLESRCAGLELQKSQFESHALEVESTCQHWIAAYQAVIHSRSWRITSPGRRLGDKLRYLKRWTLSWKWMTSTPDSMKATTALYPIRDAAYYQNQHDECLAYRENNWLLERFDLIKQLPGSSIAEYGCGNCRFLETAASHFAQVYGFDWAEAPHLQDVLRQHSNVHFEKRDIVRNSPAIRTHIAASADFLEHLIPSDVGCVIRHMHRSATINFHVIACYDDTHSHQTIMPPEEWLRLFQRCSQDYYLLCIWQRNDDPSKLVCIVTNHVFPKGQQALNLPGQCHPHYGRKNGDVADRNLLPQTAATPAQYVETRVQQAEAAPEDANKSLNAIRTNRSWRMTALLRWLGRQARLLQDQGLFARMKKLVKKTAKFVLLPWVRCVDAHPKLRRFCASFARIIGVHAPLKAIYLRLSLRHNYNSLATLNLEQTHADGEGLAVPLSSPETITIDEILSRIRAELAAAKGKQE